MPTFLKEKAGTTWARDDGAGNLFKKQKRLSESQYVLLMQNFKHDSNNFLKSKDEVLKTNPYLCIWWEVEAY